MNTWMLAINVNVLFNIKMLIVMMWVNMTTEWVWFVYYVNLVIVQNEGQLIP